MNEPFEIRIVVPILLAAYGLGLLWLFVDAVRKFGWQSLVAKACMFINGSLSLVFAGRGAASWAAHQPPTRYAHLRLGTEIAFYVAILIWLYLLLSPRAMRWLMIPFLKWASYICASCWIVVIFAIRKRWI